MNNFKIKRLLGKYKPYISYENWESSKQRRSSNRATKKHNNKIDTKIMSYLLKIEHKLKNELEGKVTDKVFNKKKSIFNIDDRLEDIVLLADNVNAERLIHGIITHTDFVESHQRFFNDRPSELEKYGESTKLYILEKLETLNNSTKNKQDAVRVNENNTKKSVKKQRVEFIEEDLTK